MTVYTLFGQPASPATVVADTNAYTMGVQFSVSAPAALTAVWFYSAPDAGSLPGTIALYAATGASLVHSETASWSGAAGSGWVRAAFTSPPPLTAATAYVACVFDSPGVNNWYSATAHYWDTGPGAGGIVNGPLAAPDNAGTVNGQDVFNTGSSLAFPATSFNAANYWADPEVTVTASAAVPLAYSPVPVLATVLGVLWR